MNLALEEGMKIFAKAIDDVKRTRITHIAVKDESTDTVIEFWREPTRNNRIEFAFYDPTKPWEPGDEIPDIQI